MDRQLMHLARARVRRSEFVQLEPLVGPILRALQELWGRVLATVPGADRFATALHRKAAELGGADRGTG